MVNEQETPEETPDVQEAAPTAASACSHPAEEDAHQGDFFEEGKRFAHYICRLCGRERKTEVEVAG